MNRVFEYLFKPKENGRNRIFPFKYVVITLAIFFTIFFKDVDYFKTWTLTIIFSFIMYAQNEFFLIYFSRRKRWRR